ncbi:hypothetical protein FKD06_07710 [Serratia sp. SRS-8-S-2018]|uniref:hypothetical protein n=1 Tax=Serratia sp. SRS-8-S-2018 TaxID=2591107 RepID=UPI00113FD105|nr:hypothetical protein [Serratia sp. SRS-8-S-2018]TPW52384.1 hypothetical protein FKD06_07710 [Serratia sp. SRS-8-S-2018]
MTSTTERQQFEEWFNEEMAMPITEGNSTVVRLMWKAWQASRELLANREAQPVGKAEITKIAAELVRGDYLSKLWTEAEKSRHVDTHRLQNLLDELHDVMKVKAIAITQLLTALPARSLPPIDYEKEMRFFAGRGSSLRVERGYYTAPPAPAVNAAPDFEAWFNSPEAGLRVVNFHIQHELQLKAWSACRAAMLAQPVSGGYKLPPHLYRELVNSLRDTAVKFSDTEQLRERLNTALSQFIEPDHPHTRTVAPEGGNDHDTRR